MSTLTAWFVPCPLLLVSYTACLLVCCWAPLGMRQLLPSDANLRWILENSLSEPHLAASVLQDPSMLVQQALHLQKPLSVMRLSSQHHTVKCHCGRLWPSPHFEQKKNPTSQKIIMCLRGLGVMQCTRNTRPMLCSVDMTSLYRILCRRLPLSDFRHSASDIPGIPP